MEQKIYMLKNKWYRQLKLSIQTLCLVQNAGIFLDNYFLYRSAEFCNRCIATIDVNLFLLFQYYF